MRCITLFALSIAVLGCFLAPQAAQAQAWTAGECTVSLWWPYSREAGDCLTNAERSAGETGTYRDPDGYFLRTAVATRALRNLEGCEASAGPAPVVQSISERTLVRGTTDMRIIITGSNFRCNSQAYFNAIPVPTNVVSATQIEMIIPQELPRRDGNYPIVVRNRTPVAVAGGGQRVIPNELVDEGGVPAPGAAPQRREITNERGCTTSITWPYFRKPGDCLTDAERERGMVGVYGNSRVAGQTAPNESNGTIAPLPASTSSGGILGIFGSSEPNYGGGGLLDDNLLPPEQRDQ